MSATPDVIVAFRVFQHVETEFPRRERRAILPDDAAVLFRKRPRRVSIVLAVDRDRSVAFSLSSSLLHDRGRPFTATRFEPVIVCRELLASRKKISPGSFLSNFAVPRRAHRTTNPSSKKRNLASSSRESNFSVHTGVFRATVFDTRL